MQILRIEDPRNSLSKASRYELVSCAQAHGIKEISYGSSLQLDDMIRILRENGIQEIKVPERPLGVYVPVVLESQHQAPQSAPAQEHDVSAMPMTELRKACKAAGIKMVRTDNLETLRAKLNGKNAA